MENMGRREQWTLPKRESQIANRASSLEYNLKKQNKAVILYHLQHSGLLKLQNFAAMNIHTQYICI